MTFLEAAIEVLRHETGPLHYGEIARLAVERKLLSHVGRDPEAAMKSCLMSAVRAGVDAPVERAKPGHYQVRPGATLPEPSAPPAPKPSAKPAAADEGDEGSGDGPSGTRAKKTAKKSAKKTTRRSGRKPSEASSAMDAEDAAPTGGPDGDAADAADAAGDERPRVEFEAPAGSGLEGVTDVALVMANAMSRLAHERPELRQELEAMQQNEAQVPEIKHKPTLRGEPGTRGKTSARARAEEAEDRGGGRRRRRRRKKGRRVEWSDPAGATGAGSSDDLLLERAESALAAAGARSLHVRQIAEALAGEGILGGEVSEIERAVTAALLLDARDRGERSRFVLRGDARYQLRAGRVPERVGAAENAFRSACLNLENETRLALSSWLSSLGVRSLETLARMYLTREGARLVVSLPPGRGVSRLVVTDPEADGERVLVVVVPRKTTIEARTWEEEPELERCPGGVWLFAPGEAPDTGDGGPELRHIGAEELVDWLMREGIGTRTLEVSVPVLDPALIESIGGLDT